MGKCISKCIQLQLGDKKSLLSKKKRSQQIHYVQENSPRNQINVSLGKDNFPLESDRQGNNVENNDKKTKNMVQNFTGFRRKSKEEKYKYNQQQDNSNNANLDNEGYQTQQIMKQQYNKQENITQQSSNLQFTENNPQFIEDLSVPNKVQQNNLNNTATNSSNINNMYSSNPNLRSKEYLKHGTQDELKSNTLSINVQQINEESTMNTQQNALLSSKSQQLSLKNSQTKSNGNNKKYNYNVFSNHFSPIRERNGTQVRSKQNSISNFTQDMDISQNDGSNNKENSQYLRLNSGDKFQQQQDLQQYQQDDELENDNQQQNQIMQFHYIEEEENDTSYSVNYEKGMREHVFS